MSERVGSHLYAALSSREKREVWPQASFLRQLEKELREENYLKRPLNELPVVVFDVETTGFFPEQGDRILSIGAVRAVGQHILEED
ncbi:exonuclease domain-containing protein, partial [Caldalkalibacillus thermarum]|uniref:exonuclease domain-containing protein n=1 Tax=Caldalkalibacillus thermarum TaxID=296745 RepID=UPI00227CBADD